MHLTLSDFAELLGTTIDRIPPDCVAKIQRGNWTYDVLTEEARDHVVIDLLERIAQRKLTVVANEDKSRWMQGWGENLEHFRAQRGSLEALIPRYIRAGQPVRLFGNFVRTEDPEFELHWYDVFRAWLFQTQLARFSHIFEFGCGSGFNVATLGSMYPDVTIYGLDWAQPSVDIVEGLRAVHGFNVHGRLFDFFHPDMSLDFPPNSAVLTIGALEQTGTDWEAFVEFLLMKRPTQCVHIEPIYEWYEAANLTDYTAMKAHEVRNFWRGFPSKLMELENAGRVTVHKTKRAFFGSLVLEGYSQIIWSPR